MKRSFLLLLILVMALCVSTCLVSCNTDTDAPAGDQNTPDNGNGDTDAPAGDDTGDGIDWNNTGLTGIPMIYNSKARFQIVYTAEGGSSAIKAANDLVAQLRELGVDIGDAVSDKNADDVKEYEITDNVSTVENFRVMIYIYDESYHLLSIDKDSFIPTKEGEYYVRIWCIDEHGNYAVASYKIYAR